MPSLTGVRHNGIALSRNHANFVELLRDSGYATALIGKSHLQSFTGEPAVNRFKAEPGLATPPEPLRDAHKDHRTGAAYEYENIMQWPVTAQSRHKEDSFYGFDHFELVADHGDRACGDYRLWALAREPNFDKLVGPGNALPDQRIKAPQAWRTAVPEELYSTRFIEERTVAALEQCALEPSKPFFIQMSFPDPHHPFTPPGKYWDMYSPEDFHPRLPYEAHKNPTPPMRWLHDHWTKGTRQAQTQEAFMANERETREAMALSCGMITMIDDAIGEVINALKAAGKYENTVIVFNSDHGDYLGDFNLMLKGAVMLDSINNVSMIWSDPADRTARVSHALSSTIDLAPSIIERAGLKHYWGIQGKSLLGNVAGSHDLRDELVIEYEDTQPRMGFEKSAVVRTLITADHRLTLYKGMPWGELYDRRNDPDDTHNVWDDPAYAGVRAELTERLVHELMENVDKSPHARRRA